MASQQSVTNMSEETPLILEPKLGAANYYFLEKRNRRDSIPNSAKAQSVPIMDSLPPCSKQETFTSRPVNVSLLLQKEKERIL